MAELEDLQRKLEELKEAGRRAEQQTADFGRMREEISALQTSVTSADKCVTVTSGPGGSVTGITFTQDAMKLSPLQLSSTVMSTLQQAVAEAARKQAEIVQEYVPDGDVLERVLQTQEQMLGTTLDRPQQQTTTPDPDDDDEPDSFLDSRGY
jgi:DNA-binding protein YbaB